MKCRHCQTKLENIFLDLVNCPPSNAMLTENQLNEPEVYLPLKVSVCKKCRLVSVTAITDASLIFNDNYTYFSSYSKSWLAHAKSYVDMMISRFHLNGGTKVIEIASNDGYLLQYFKQQNFDVLGIDPTANTAEAAEQKGIKTIVDFFGSEFAQTQLVDQGILGNLIIGNNVLAHVPNINDFVLGMKKALHPSGIITMEFPHLLKLVEECQFDTIYHEHYSYLSFTTTKNIFESVGLEMFDVEEIPTHGGSLRIFAKHKEDSSKEISPNVDNLLKKEDLAGMNKDEYYQNFADKVNKIKNDFLRFLLDAHQQGKKVIGYGAAAKGNTLINYCAIKGNDLIEYVVDASPAKQNKYLPGSHIPVCSIEKIQETKPDYIIILPWNLKNEIVNQLSFTSEWGCKFVTAIPHLEVFQYHDNRIIVD
ncbi:MAG: methyltransferase domain-containing protein [Bacteroidales bacterium]|nr:methyltransferase domain-containing protein [Bacteroidales bacterium]